MSFPTEDLRVSETFFVYAKFYVSMGNIEKTLEYLEKAKEAGFDDWQRIEEENEFETVRKDPRIREFLIRK